MNNKNVLKGKTVADIRTLVVKEPTTISPEADMRELLYAINDDMKTRHVYVVDEQNHLVGSVRMNSVVQYLFPFSAVLSIGVQLQSPLTYTLTAKNVSDLMKMEPFVVKENDSLEHCARIMIDERINELPVVDDDMKLIGQVNVHEMIEAYKAVVSRN